MNQELIQDWARVIVKKLGAEGAKKLIDDIDEKLKKMDQLPFERVKVVRTFQIWSEGFRATGESAGAHYHGSSIGKDFKEACDRFAEENLTFWEYYDPNRMTFWGCKLYDNEHEARLSFG